MGKNLPGIDAVAVTPGLGPPLPPTVAVMPGSYSVVSRPVKTVVVVVTAVNWSVSQAHVAASGLRVVSFDAGGSRVINLAESTPVMALGLFMLAFRWQFGTQSPA